MADETRTQLLEYIAGSPDDTLIAHRSVSDTQPISDERVKEIREQINRLHQAGGEQLSGSDEPTEFAQKLAAREDTAREIDNHGKPVPRWREDSRVMKPIYFAHDVVVKLPQPGGIGVLLLVLLVLFLVLIPATTQGETRTILLWDVLLGKKRVNDPNAPMGIVVHGNDGSLGVTAHLGPGWGPISQPTGKGAGGAGSSTNRVADLQPLGVVVMPDTYGGY